MTRGAHCSEYELTFHDDMIMFMLFQEWIPVEGLWPQRMRVQRQRSRLPEEARTFPDPSLALIAERCSSGSPTSTDIPTSNAARNRNTIARTVTTAPSVKQTCEYTLLDVILNIAVPDRRKSEFSG